MNYFPTYEQSAEKVAAVEAAAKEDSDPATHYDAAREVRARAAGFYKFSQDEETRQKQMADLKRSREETGKARDESGAGTVGKEVRLGMEKRKREIEERRRVIEAKRRKIKDPNGLVGKGSIESSTGPSSDQEQSSGQPQSADEFLAALERDIMAERRHRQDDTKHAAR